MGKFHYNSALEVGQGRALIIPLKVYTWSHSEASWKKKKKGGGSKGEAFSESSTSRIRMSDLAQTIRLLWRPPQILHKGRVKNVHVPQFLYGSHDLKSDWGDAYALWSHCDLESFFSICSCSHLLLISYLFGPSKATKLQSKNPGCNTVISKC